ncbi:hypothetical protein [Zhengella mangrovi]|uniref:hypothetical protein n=1 Tax=Zhengella mangrovi TaxID=1982044 RepID=UPI00197C33A4|nr:hypothetical protein [Zhengella mangrovi]
MMKRPLHVLIAFATLAAASASLPATASADSCWDHNGSVMRLQAEGNRRWFTYERPKGSLRAAGVRRGTLLFNGRKSGDWYSGTARRFSRHCPGDPLEYHVEGPVSRSQTRVTVRGTREIYDQCEPTGEYTEDTLVFTYLRQC